MGSNDPAIEGLGIAVTAVGDGTATATMSVSAEMVNRHGVCHGGHLFLLADTTMDYATNADAADGTSFAVHAEIDYLAPAHVGDEVTAVGTIRHTWGRSSLLDAVVTNGDGVTIAHFRGRTRHVNRGPAT